MPSETFTISDVSQQTGVASITLRAWERRYGLVKPQRTLKGHRVYTQQNIDEIKQIVAWLNRGVTISKVAPLLADNGLNDYDVQIDQHWYEHVQVLMSALLELKQVTVNQLCDKLNKTLPFHTLCLQVYHPLCHLLQQRWQDKPLGYQLEQQLWQQVWQRQITVMTLRAEKQKSPASCWLINLDQQSSNIDYCLLHALLLQSGIRVHAISANAAIEGLIRLEHQTEWGLMIYADMRLDSTAIAKLTELQIRWQKRLLTVGSVVDIHHEQFEKYKLNALSGDICSLWTSTAMQTWLKQIESA